MKNKVIAILADKELKPAQKFNALLEQFRANPQHTPSTMRYLNSAGFTAINLKNLEYDIKKLYAIKDSEVASFKAAAQELPKPQKTQEEINAEVYARAKEAFAQEEELSFTDKQKVYLDILEITGTQGEKTEPEAVPEFSKGLPGNKEMITWLDERKVQHTAKKKDELLAEVEKQLHKEYDDQLTDHIATLKVWTVEYESWLQNLTTSENILDGTIEELEEYLAGETDKVVLSGLVGEEFTGKNRAGAIKAIEYRIDEIDIANSTGAAPDGDVPVNYDEMEYNDLKTAAAERTQQTGEAPADQKKATLLEYLKKKA